MKHVTVLVVIMAAMITGVVMASNRPAPIVRMVQQQSEMTWLQVNDDGQLIGRFGVISAEIPVNRDGAAIEWRNGGGSTRYFEADWRERVELLATQAAEIAACERATFDPGSEQYTVYLPLVMQLVDCQINEVGAMSCVGPAPTPGG